jgi:lipid-A-disaccharide synthase-like uncharacterized protein
MIENYFRELLGNLNWIEAIGFLGNGLFFSRFVVQWLASERAKKSIIPDAFWYLSIVGSLICLVYGCLLQRPALILPFIFNSIFYVRNLVLIYRHRRQASPSGDAAQP